MKAIDECPNCGEGLCYITHRAESSEDHEGLLVLLWCECDACKHGWVLAARPIPVSTVGRQQVGGWIYDDEDVDCATHHDFDDELHPQEGW